MEKTKIADIASQSAGKSVTALDSKSYTWNTINVGDCTMFAGATWTVYSDGHATFDGTVTSGDNNDAWLMWPHLKDTNGSELAMITTTPGGTDTEFSQNMPSKEDRYRFLATGYFSQNLYGLIGGMSIDCHC